MKLRLPPRTTRNKRFAAAIALPSLLLCSFSQAPANAGTWTFTITGSTTPDTFMGPPQYDPNKPTVSGTVGLYTPVSVNISSGQLGTISPSKATSATFTVTVTGTYHPSQGETMPATAPMLEKANLDVGGGETVNYSWSVSGTDGLGDSVTNPTLTNGYNPNSGATGSYVSGTAAGAYLITVPCPSFTLTRTATASLQGSAASWGGGAGYDYSIAPDSRTVKLSRNSLDRFDADGNAYGDTTYSFFKQFQDPLAGQFSVAQYNWQDITSTLTGKWSPLLLGLGHNVSWSWSPNESNDDSTDGIWQVMLGQCAEDRDLDMLGPLDAPQTKQITYTATDNVDGAVATSTYTFTVHDPFDNFHPDPNYPIVSLVSQYYYLPTGGGSLYSIENDEPVNTSDLEWPTGTWSFTITATGGVGLTLAGDFKQSDLEVFKPGVTLSFSIAVGTSLGINSGKIPPQTRSFPYVRVAYSQLHYLVDKWTADGYAGTWPQSFGDMSNGTTSPGWTPPQPIDNTIPVP